MATTTRDYKRCPQCSTTLRANADWCSACGLHMPRGASESSRIPKDLSEAMQELGLQGLDMPRYFIFVALDKYRLFQYLIQKFAGAENVHVYLERRGRERRKQPKAVALERRRRDRRNSTTIEVELQTFGFAIVRVDRTAFA